MLTVAQLGVRVTADTIGAQTQLRGMQREVQTTHNAFKQWLGSTLSMAAGQAVFAGWSLAIGEVSRAVRSAIDETIQWDDATAQLAAVLKSTKDVSGLTADELKNFAIAASQTTKFTDDQVLSAENVMLTFTKLGKDVFPTATTAVMDMATALHQDLQSAVIQVGKALQDPTGVTALRRMGVNFSKEFMQGLQEQFNRGDVAGYQASIIKELQTEFGGSAAAAGTTLSGQIAIMQHKFQDMAQTVGEEVLPTFIKLLDRLEPVAEAVGKKIPDAIDTAKGMFHAIQPILDEVGGVLQSVGGDVQTLAGGFLDGFSPDKTQLATKLDDAIKNVQYDFGLVKQAVDDLKPSMHDIGQGIGEVTDFLNNMNTALREAGTNWDDLKGAIPFLGPTLQLSDQVHAAERQAGIDPNTGKPIPGGPAAGTGGVTGKGAVVPTGAGAGASANTTHNYYISGPDPKAVVAELQRQQRRVKAVNRA